jgi:hypothetical protein
LLKRKWLDLKEAYPEYFQDHKVIVDRIRQTNKTVSARQFLRPLGESAINQFMFGIKTGGKDAPIPERFQNVDRGRIRQYIPRQHWRAEPQIIETEDAALGYAAPVHLPDYPLNFGFHQRDRKEPGPLRRLKKDDITPGQYAFYELGTVTITKDCLIWFSARSWQTNLQLGSLYEPGADNNWKAYASMKFEGRTYGGEGETDRVLVDRVILISQSPDQFKAEE